MHIQYFIFYKCVDLKERNASEGLSRNLDYNPKRKQFIIFIIDILV